VLTKHYIAYFYFNRDRYSISKRPLTIRIGDVTVSDKSSQWEYTKTSGFEVFKMDANTSHLRRLHGLDDQVVFLSCSGAITVSARDLVLRWKPNMRQG